MGTMNQFEDRLRPFKLALIEAFGLTPEQTGTQISADKGSVTFRIVVKDDAERKALREGPLAPANLRYESGEFPSATFPAPYRTPEQSQAVTAYLEQFPSFEDLPKELRRGFRADRP